MKSGVGPLDQDLFICSSLVASISQDTSPNPPPKKKIGTGPHSCAGTYISFYSRKSGVDPLAQHLFLPLVGLPILCQHMLRLARSSHTSRT